MGNLRMQRGGHTELYINFLFFDDNELLLVL